MRGAPSAAAPTPNSPHTDFPMLQQHTLDQLRGLRLDRAEALLARGLPLETAALQCGYASASALAMQIRTCSPAENCCGYHAA